MDVFEELPEPIVIPSRPLTGDDERDVSFALFETVTKMRGYNTMTSEETARFKALAELLRLNLRHEGILLTRWATQRDYTDEERAAMEVEEA